VNVGTVLPEGVESVTCRYTSATRFLWVARMSASTIKATAGIGCGWRRRNCDRQGVAPAKSSQVHATREAGAR
jgi:hypothetical protein